jgi:hypothetical protein
MRAKERRKIAARKARQAETDKADADLLERGIDQAEIDIMPKRVRRVAAAMIIKELGFLQTMELDSDNAVPRKIRKIEAGVVAAIKHACKCMSACNDYSSDCFARSMYWYSTKRPETEKACMGIALSFGFLPE